MMCDLRCVWVECFTVVSLQVEVDLQKVRWSSNLPVNAALLSRILWFCLLRRTVNSLFKADGTLLAIGIFREIAYCHLS